MASFIIRGGASRHDRQEAIAMAEAAKQKQVSIMCFHDELCQVFNALMTALNLLRQGARVTVFFGSRGDVNGDVNGVGRKWGQDVMALG